MGRQNERAEPPAGSWTSGLRTRCVECHWRKQNGPSHKLPADNNGQFLHSKCIARQFHLAMLYRLRRYIPWQRLVTAKQQISHSGRRRLPATVADWRETEKSNSKLRIEPRSCQYHYQLLRYNSLHMYDAEPRYIYLGLCTSVLISTDCPLYTVPERTQSVHPSDHADRDTIKSTATHAHSSPLYKFLGTTPSDDTHPFHVVVCCWQHNISAVCDYSLIN